MLAIGGTPSPGTTGEPDDRKILVRAPRRGAHTAGQIPVHTDIQAAPGGLRARFAVIDAAAATHIGSIPKAVSLHELRCAPGRHGWSCSVTTDV